MYPWCDTFSESKLTNLLSAITAYEAALEESKMADSVSDDVISKVIRRYGNVHNELGVLYMNEATSQLTGQGNETLYFYPQKSKHTSSWWH